MSRMLSQITQISSRLILRKHKLSTLRGTETPSLFFILGLWALVSTVSGFDSVQ